MFYSRTDRIVSMKSLILTVILCSMGTILGCNDRSENTGILLLIPETERQIGITDPPDMSIEPENSIPLLEPSGGDNMMGSLGECAGIEQRACENVCGMQTCVQGAWSDCANGVEQCNGHDDDCDENIDENLGVGMTCTNRQDDGCVGSGLLVCDSETQSVVCDAQPAEPQAEACDGMDNDCDGTPDEDFPNQRCCTEDYQCPPSASCVDNECVGGPDGGSTGGSPGFGSGSGNGACLTLLDCPFGQTCASGMCTAMCFTHQDCSIDEHCGCPPEDPGCLLMACLPGAPMGQGGGGGDPNCENTIVIEGPGQYGGSTNNHANDMTSSCGNGGRGRDIVFSARFAEGQQVVIDTTGSDFDTVLSVRNQCGDANTEIECDDDGAGRTFSEIRMNVVPDQDYFIIVHGFGQRNQGNVILNIQGEQNGGNAGGGENGAACNNSCQFANDDACDDGGPGSSFSVCNLGTDCNDCGPR
jgi:hypothetical protein